MNQWVTEESKKDSEEILWDSETARTIQMSSTRRHFSVSTRSRNDYSRISSNIHTCIEQFIDQLFLVSFSVSIDYKTRSESNWLVKYWCVAGLIFVNDGRYERDQLVPELEAWHAAWSLILDVITKVTRLAVRLELSLVQLVAVVEEKLVGRLETGLGTVLDDVTGAWWRRQVLNLQQAIRHSHFTSERMTDTSEQAIRYSHFTSERMTDALELAGNAMMSQKQSQLTSGHVSAVECRP